MPVWELMFKKKVNFKRPNFSKWDPPILVNPLPVFQYMPAAVRK